MPATMTPDEYAARLAHVQPDIAIVAQYVRSALPVTVRHTCGHQWSPLPRNLLKGHGCPKCAVKRTHAAATKTTQQFKRELKKVNPELVVIGEYVNAKTPVRVRHTCKHEWAITPTNALNRRGCPRCSKYKVHTVKLGKRCVQVRGYEPQAIEWLQRDGIKADRIAVESEGAVPTFRYRFNKTACTYKPDILVGRTHIVEVKSLATAGLRDAFYYRSAPELFAVLKAKARAVTTQGFVFHLMLIHNNGTRIKVPKNWFNMTHAQWVAHFKKRGYR